jgi:group II intron reverse transcriptase/maturase
VREVARRDKEARFTALLHHVDADRLRAAYWAINPKAATGVDGVTWGAYGQDLEANLSDLHQRIHAGRYRAKPSRRVYIPKADGRQRPLGIATLEDKILQRAVVEVLNAIYEQDFLGFSYGFRPGRSPHDALDALSVGIERKKVNWVLDADLRDFFTSLDHGWLEKFLEHRIADKRVLRLIQKWVSAGVIEDGAWMASETGAPQGASASPLLANIYLHYVLDRWARQWRRRNAHGDVVIVRFADDFVAGFEHEVDAQRFLAELRERLAKFNLELHPDKTRLIEFGRNAARDRAARGVGKPETFDFLGFTHYCAKTRAGRFWLKRKTSSKRMRAKLAEVKDQCLLRRLSQYRYKANGWQAWCEGTSPTTPCPATPRQSGPSAARRCDTGSRRFGTAASAPASTGSGCTDSQLGGCRLPACCIPLPMCASTPAPKAGAQCGSSARWDLRGGPPARAVPTAIVRECHRTAYVTRERPSPPGTNEMDRDEREQCPTSPHR